MVLQEDPTPSCTLQVALQPGSVKHLLVDNVERSILLAEALKLSVVKTRMKTEAPGCTHITGFAGTFECPNSSSDIRHMLLPTLNQHVKVPIAFNIPNTQIPRLGRGAHLCKLCNKYGFPHSVTSLPVLGGNLEVLEPEYGSPSGLERKPSS